MKTSYVKLSAPTNIQWELSPWCNHNCIYCYNYWRVGADPKLNVTSEQRLLHDTAAQEIINSGVFDVTITGGEPLGVIQWFTEPIEKLKNAGIVLSINSNLTLLTPDLANLLKRLGIYSVLTSIQSSDPNINDELAQRRGAQKRTLEGIKLAIEYGLRVSVNMVVTKKNLHTVRDTGKLAKEIGASTFCATKAATPFNCPDFSEYELTNSELSQMLFDLIWVNKNYGIRIETLEHYPSCVFPDDETMTILGSRSCSAGKTGCTIGFDGQIRPCSHAHVTYGNVTDGLKSAWDKMDEWRNVSLVPEFCKDSCNAFPFGCEGGCRIAAYVSCGSISASDPYCVNKPPIAKRLSKQYEPIPENATLKLTKNAKFRLEKFGYIAYGGSHNWAPIDEKLYDLLINHGKNGGFRVRDLLNIYDVPESSAISTAQLLISKRIVKIVN